MIEAGDIRILTVDIGNSNITIGFFADQELVDVRRMVTDHSRSSGSYRQDLMNILAESPFSNLAIAKAVLASVVPDLTGVIAEALRQTLHIVPRVIDQQTDFGINNLTDQPGSVGIDRLVNVAAACQIYGGPALVIDFGTATTYDLITAQGEFLGGVIAPGLKISAEALWQRAAQLPRIEIVKPGQVLGTDTIRSMQSGIFYGYLGQVEYLVNRLKTEYGADLKVIATGGLAVIFKDCTQAIDVFDEHLTLKGMRLLC